MVKNKKRAGRRLAALLLAMIMIFSLWSPALGLGEGESTFALSYDANGADGGEVPASVTGAANESVIVASQTSDPLVKAGYVFAGWNTEANGSGYLYFPGRTITLTTDTTLYAHWAPVYEAEDGDLLGGAKVEGRSVFPNASGAGVVGYLDEEGNGFTLSNLAAANAMVLRYAADGSGRFSILINDEFRQHIEFLDTGSWSNYGEIIIYLTINQGDSITFIHQSGDTPLNVDYIALLSADKVEVEGIVVDASPIALSIGSRKRLEAAVVPEDAFNNKLVWSSSAPSIARVSSNGVVQAVSSGTAVITVKAADNPEIRATIPVTVTNPPGGVPYAVEISGGSYHMIALMSDRTVMALGSNEYGQLGAGSYMSSDEEPVHVMMDEVTPLTGIKAISSNYYHNLALDQEGQVWAWGSNWDYESGVEDAGEVPYATQISAFEELEIQAIAAGGYHSLALDSTGRVWAWGDNYDGQLGIGDEDDQFIPQLVQTEDGEALEGITAISAGDKHSVALDENGRIWAWGDGYAVSPYDPSNSIWYADWEYAKPISEEADVFTAISAGVYHSLAIDAQGGVRAWGVVFDDEDYEEFIYNKSIEIGDGSVAAAAIFSTKTYASSSYIRLVDGSNWCWGLCGDVSSIYTMKVEAALKQEHVMDMIRFTSMYEKVLGLKEDGTLWYWSPFIYLWSSEAPVQSSANQIVFADAGDTSTYVIKSDGLVYAWGDNEYGQAGVNSSDWVNRYDAEQPSPVVDVHGDPITSIAVVDAGRYHALALSEDGKVWSWGRNNNYQLGNEIDDVVPYASLIEGLSNIVEVSAGRYHNLARKQDGTIVAWGDNGYQQIGGGPDYDGGDTSVAVAVYGLTDVKTISAGYYHSVAVIGDDRTVWQWGDDMDIHQIHLDASSPLQDIIAVEAGDEYTYGLRNDGTVWGWLSYDEDFAEQVYKQDGQPLTGITAIDFTEAHILALDNNNEVWAWGNNGYGQAGAYDNDQWKGYPEKIAGISGVRQVGAGYDHSIIVLSDGTLMGLGSNYYSELAVDYKLLAETLYPMPGFKAKVDPNTGGEDTGGSDGGGDTGGGTVAPIQSNEPIITTNGRITVPASRSGETTLNEEIILTIPAGASDEELVITIDKLLDTANLFNHGEILASSVFELLKNVADNFQKPVSITIKFDPALVKEGQRVSIFYFDETELVWVEVGGEVKGDLITAEVDHFTKFAALIVNEGKEEEAQLPSFSDIAGHWGEAQIKQAVQQGIVNGYPDGTFKPNAHVTHAQFSVMLTNALKLEGAGAALRFTDELNIGDWAKSAVARLVEKGIVSGYEDGTFRPAANISRAELAVMAARATGGAEAEPAATSFTDDSDIPVWAKPAVAKVHAAGIVSGRGDNRFAPKANATRAEAVTIILNLLKAK